ncbi:MAG: AI-2E family transporter [Tissierellaceae bacterium]|nr:AI-2E family transporter [Tissierellia bacterium]
MKNKDSLRIIINDIKHGLRGYLKAQIILMILTFIIFSIGLVIVDAPFPLLMGTIIALVDILPVLGSGIILIPWTVISLLSGNSDLALGLAMVYIIGSLIRQLLEPKITGDKMGIKPIYTFLASLLGTIILGPIGVILGPIFAVIIKSISTNLKKGNDRDL